ncbi:MAG: sigma-70 family RNA polymerase sigma factor [Anaerolineales bacterium]|jgi:RNA polymerase sigma-70 factor (ECF subfamily)
MNAQNTIPSKWGLANIMTGYDENSELEGLKNLDSKVIGTVYDRYFPEVYRFIYYRLGDEQVAEDISSDVFVRLLEAVKKQRGPRTNVKGWLLSTASHAVADYLRQVYRRPVEELQESTSDDSVPSLVDEIDHREKVYSIRDAYAQLTPDQQNVLALRFGDGYSLEETARVMQKNVNAIKALQFRALAALQRNIGEVANE